MAYGAYQGRFLDVDLSEGRAESHPVPQDMQRLYLGGDGVAARILWDSLAPGVDPLAPGNVLVIATGPLTGTLFPPSGRWMAASLSPLTFHWGEAHAGGFFGAELKYAGYDYLVIRGKASAPVWLNITDGRAELRPAAALWGKTVPETTESIARELGDPEVKVACIGPAGEKLVRYAAIMSDYWRAAGRTGMGAVMGAKGLKAIAVRGFRPVRVADPEGFLAACREAHLAHREGEWADYIRRTSRRYGTTGLTDAMNAIGRLPVKNHQDGYLPDVERVGCEAIRQGYRVAHKACFGCALQCKYVSHVSSGPYRGTRSEGPEYETVDAWGPNILVYDLDVVMRANYLCNIYGLDTISAGAAVAFAMELYERGLIGKEETGGMEIRWGDGEVALALLEQIARREGFGRLLGEGCDLAARELGGEAWRYSISVNGLEASGQDPRSHKSVGCTYATNVRGADHLRSLSVIDELGFRSKAVERFPHLDPDVCGNLLDETYKGYMVADQEECFAVCDSMILCKYGVMWPPIYYFPEFARAISTATGMAEYADPEAVRALGRRICHLRRAFNVRLGWDRSRDTLHPRFTEEPMPSGPARGEVCRLEPMLREYYEVRGYDQATGLPYRETLEEAGLGDVAEELARLGRLAGGPRPARPANTGCGGPGRPCSLGGTEPGRGPEGDGR